MHIKQVDANIKRMDTKRRTPLLLSAIAGALSLAVAGAAFAQAPIQLRWGHYLAEGPFVQLEKDFAAKIEKRTNGRVKIAMTFAGGLGKGTELLMLVGKGALDMTATAPGYNPDQLRYWRAFQTPFVFQTSKQAMELLVKVVEEFPVYKQEFEKIGARWLFQQPLGEYYMTGSSPDCISVDKLKGKKIRSFGADIPKAFTAIGAVPVTVPPPGIYEALQHRNLDYSFINAGNIQQYKLQEVAKYNCGPTMAITGHNISISKRTWDRLPADVQKIFLDQSRETMAEYLAWVGDFEQKAVANLKAQGAIFTPFPAAELKKWRSMTPDFLAEWEKATAAATGDAETPKKVAARWRQLLAQ
ncbi:MAG: TRAP transporter substrate-binding protein DctP [Proteobacteria bacterium]|nr:TRAP transporter substrate-binding protein DctP [Pseudomonadota bacterium]